MYFWLLLSSFVANGAYSVCAPILPLELAKKGITGTWVGITFAIYSIGSICWAPFVGKHLIERISGPNLLGLSLGIMGATFVCFGLIENMESKESVLVLSFILRLLEGMAGTTQWTTALAMIARIAKEPGEKEYWLGINTSLFGLGLMAGPLISSALFAFMGYKLMFFAYGGTEIILAIIIRFCLSDPTT